MGHPMSASEGKGYGKIAAAVERADLRHSSARRITAVAVVERQAGTCRRG
jgi:hypothetical protein